jgi:outer membrane protein TolC
MHTRFVFAALAAAAWLAPGALVHAAPATAAPTDVPADSLAADSTLSLAALERWVLERNPDLEAMRQGLAAAGERSKMAGALMDPELEFTVGPASFDEADLPAAYRIGVKQRLPWAKLGPQRSVARHEASADSAGVAALRNQVLRLTRATYVEYWQGDASLRVVRELQGLIEEFRRVALSRYASGLVGEADPLMAEAEQARLEHDAITYTRLRDTARAQLNSLLHREGGAPLPAAPAGFPPPGSVPPLATLVGHAVRNRPEVAAAEARARAGQARLTLAGRQWLPDVEVMAAYDRFMMEEPYRPMVGVSVNLPLWFGRISAARREAQAGVAEGVAATAGARDRVAFEVQEAYARVLDSAHEAGIVRHAELPVNQRALGAARAGYESGRNDFLTLLNAERDLTRARLAEIRVAAEYRMGLADLEQAVGVALAGAFPETPANEEGTR